jgi:hypothetical protein
VTATNTQEETWLTGNITSDLYAGLNGVKRAKYLEEWTRNKNLMFTKENMLKLEAAYGPRYVESLKDILRRMETGVNRPEESNRIEDMVMNWVNGSVGVTMFLNTRSAVLQTISTINFTLTGKTIIHMQQVKLWLTYHNMLKIGII